MKADSRICLGDTSRSPRSRGLGVDVLGPDCLVAIDYLDPGQPANGFHLHFTSSEWDEIVRAVANRRREILTRLNLTERDGA